MARRILVATDFSEHSEVAGRIAVSLAAGSQGRVTLLHVDQTPEALTDDAEPLLAVRPELWRQYRESSRRKVDAGLGAQIADLQRWTAGSPSAAPGGSATASIDGAVDYADVASAIERRARAWPADLIAMGAHGAGAGEHGLFGSALTKLLPSAPCPVLVARAGQRDRIDPGAGGFRRPLVAIDYSRFAEPSVRHALVLAAPGATIELVHVWRPPLLNEDEDGPPLSEADHRDLAAAAALALDRESARIEAFRRAVVGGAPARCSVEHGRVASALLERARQLDADVIVVGAHGPEPGGDIGTVTDRVLRHSPVPVLFIPPSAIAEGLAGERSGSHPIPIASARDRSRRISP